jgi:ATP-binding cassette subfamily C (CFTR/MRP) protein 10
MLGEMHRVRGHIRVNDLELGFAMAAQEPWIQHATIKDNILFGRQFNSRKYERVIDACALIEDFKVCKLIIWVLPIYRKKYNY